MHYTMYTRFNELLNAVGLETAADRAKEMGFESVEMFSGTQPSTISDVETARQVRQIFEKRGLHFACYSVYADLYESEKHIELMMLHADLAAALGSPYLHFTILPWLSLDETKPSIEDGISFAVDAAATNLSSALTINPSASPSWSSTRKRPVAPRPFSSKTSTSSATARQVADATAIRKTIDFIAAPPAFHKDTK